MVEVAPQVPDLKPPAVWLPHSLMGISTSGILADTTRGAFGPFEGQMFVGDQGQSRVMRVFLEKVNGVYQGAAFPFREGFSSGVLRLVWGKDGSMFVGMTSRGWGSTGRQPYGLQRLEWTGLMPFEVKKVEARPDGFELTFTKPVNPELAADPSLYHVTGFTYQYHSTYGSPIINRETAPVRGVHSGPTHPARGPCATGHCPHRRACVLPLDANPGRTRPPAANRSGSAGAVAGRHRAHPHPRIRRTGNSRHR